MTFFFVLGMDAFQEITTWKSYQELFSLCNFIVMTRPGYEVKELPSVFPPQFMKEFTYRPDEKRFIHNSRLSVYFTEVTPINISSNSIRTLIKDGHSISSMLPEDVEHYVKKHKFYES